MSRGSQLAKNTLILTIGKISTQFISFFLLPLYTALLTTEEYGTVDLLNTYVSLLVPIVTFQMAQGVFRYLIEVRDKDEEKSVIVTSAVLFEIVQSVIFLIIFMIVAKWFQNDYKYFLATNVVACIFSALMLQVSRGLGNNKGYAVGSFITASLTVVLNVVFIVGFDLGAYGMLSASLISNIVCTIYLFFNNKVYKYLKLNKTKLDKIKELCKYSVPLIPNAISWWLINSSDKTIVTAVLGTGMNGIYSVSNKFSSVFITVFNIYNTAWTESTALHIKDKDSSEYISNMLNIAFKLFSCLCLGIIACMPFIYNIMVNENYSEGYYQVPILMIGSLFNVFVGLISVVYIAEKKTKEVAKISIFSAIINIVVHLVLINFIGLYAASISTLVAYATMAIIRYFDVQKYVKVRFEKNLLLKTVCMTAIVVITYYYRNTYICAIVLLIMIIYSIIMNKSLLLNGLEIAKNKITTFKNRKEK